MLSKVIVRRERGLARAPIMIVCMAWCFVAMARAEDAKILECFVGTASKPPTEEAASAFEKEHGVKIHLYFGGSGNVMSQMKLTHRGDIYFPGSSDFMERAKREGLVDPTTERRVVYLLPAICVQAGNPKKLNELKDLAGPDVRVGIGRSDSVCVGLYAEEVLRKAGLYERVKPRIVTETESCEKTAQVVALGSVDAVVGWSVFQYWNPEKILSVMLRPSEVARIGYIPIAVSTYCRQKALATAFISFLTSGKGQEIFRRWHYFVTQDEARQHTLPSTPVGGEWTRPAE